MFESTHISVDDLIFLAAASILVSQQQKVMSEEDAFKEAIQKARRLWASTRVELNEH
jgi:hypothetical protein